MTRDSDSDTSGAIAQVLALHGDVHGHVYVRVVQKLHSGSYSSREYTSAHQSLLLRDSERLSRYLGHVMLAAVGEQLSRNKNKT